MNNKVFRERYQIADGTCITFSLKEDCRQHLNTNRSMKFENYIKGNDGLSKVEALYLAYQLMSLSLILNWWFRVRIQFACPTTRLAGSLFVLGQLRKHKLEGNLILFYFKSGV